MAEDNIVENGKEGVNGNVKVDVCLSIRITTEAFQIDSRRNGKHRLESG